MDNATTQEAGNRLEAQQAATRLRRATQLAYFSGLILAGSPGGFVAQRAARTAGNLYKRAVPGRHPDQPWRYKARRNDPCPCGSGQKFKRCCHGT